MLFNGVCSRNDCSAHWNYISRLGNSGVFVVECKIDCLDIPSLSVAKECHACVCKTVLFPPFVKVKC